MKTGGEPPVTAAIGARTLAVWDAVRQSALEGRITTVEENLDGVSTCSLRRNAVAGQSHSLACSAFK